ncbi:nuclear transcription factor Y subunit B-10 [Venturia nashicola]|uniref:Nuclear transcription factor Y subunit B-10 n=1 Tax=Venturia nashicola TaxID=86259 RepID=A0A4Z1P510_9PEZI|nr:nuclear transcription factor Y subunit B-10 [Venturia nashicola]
MSSSPPKKGEAEEGEQSPQENTEQGTGQGPMDPSDTQGQGTEVEVKEQDRWLPIANVARIMKSALPENAKIAKEAKECMQECVSEFISFITSEASEKCQQEKRKTVNGEDILFAMTSLGFENYSEALKIYLARYRETLLASQKSTGPSGTAGGGTNNSAAGGNASAAAAFAEGTNDALLADGLDDATTGYDPSFAAPHNGNGSADY